MPVALDRPTAASTRKLARIAGVLFVITFITSIPALLLYDAVLNDAAYITGAGADTRVELAAFLELLLIIANIGTALALFPILKRQNEALALGYVTARVVESAFIAVGILSVLSIVTLRQDAAGADAGSLVVVGESLVAIKDWTFLLGPGFVVGVGNGLMLGYLMYRSGLVPRRMAMVGLVGGAFICASGIAVLFGVIEAGSVWQGHRDDPGVHLGAVAWHLSDRQGLPGVLAPLRRRSRRQRERGHPRAGGGRPMISDASGSAVNGGDRVAVVTGTDIVRRYGEGDTAVDALRGVSVDIAKGRLTAVMGPSGSGKSTLMHILAGLDKPTSGQVSVAGVEVTTLDDTELTKLRRDHIGFIFQFFNLLPMLTAAENIALPLRLAGSSPDKAWLAELIDKVGLGDRLTHRPSELSGGQQQRVAVARALVSRPSVMFADEPTGNLDSTTGGEILALLRDSVDSLGQTTVMVTHDAHAAAIADRVLFLADGHIVRDLGRSTAHEILEALEAVTER